MVFEFMQSLILAMVFALGLRFAVSYRIKNPSKVKLIKENYNKYPKFNSFLVKYWYLVGIIFFLIMYLASTTI
ncbi:hypothetical protein HOG16_02530 [Candidatus Woesearchaeota archaeon]|jgi:hypothetical protein|nr:hypothetical protein [Candidatus Woesearchaeota archaeon]MBT4321973.1 hypothetical protein [Candidatus Woesearchaeota archaeon]MBT4631325.1 hypothetical protein [Candidatus Woesearchaeota archaeon]